VRTACFFCRTNDRSIFERVDFYGQDLRILTDLGFEVRIATRASELVPADLYFVWWWTWAFIPVTYARLRRKPTIVTGTFDFWLYPTRSRLERALHRYALRKASANVFVSQLEFGAITEALPTNNPVYSPHGVDVEKLAPAAAARERFILTIAGSGMDQGNSSRKCIPEIIRAMPIIRRANPDVRFVIVGKKGSDFPALRGLVAEVGADAYVDFPGVIDESEKISLLQRCAVYLQPSRYEGFGLSILEAMSCGAPVVTCRAGAIPEVGGDAVRYAPDLAPEAIAETVNALLADDGARESLSTKARERAVTQFSIARRASELKAVVASLVGPPR
jgi:glycosyltransferase involved in cell wall biosynthesis